MAACINPAIVHRLFIKFYSVVIMPVVLQTFTRYIVYLNFYLRSRVERCSN